MRVTTSEALLHRIQEANPRQSYLVTIHKEHETTYQDFSINGIQDFDLTIRLHADHQRNQLLPTWHRQSGGHRSSTAAVPSEATRYRITRKCRGTGTKPCHVFATASTGLPNQRTDASRQAADQ